jgi:arylsulfatase A-like enzyme
MLLVSNVDLAPTIVEIANATSTLEMDGYSLMPLLRGETLPRAWLYFEADQKKLNVTYEAYRNKRYLYARWENGEKEFYDLQVDPYQLENLWGTELGLRSDIQLFINQILNDKDLSAKHLSK